MDVLSVPDLSPDMWMMSAELTLHNPPPLLGSSKGAQLSHCK